MADEQDFLKQEQAEIEAELTRIKQGGESQPPEGVNTGLDIEQDAAAKQQEQAQEQAPAQEEVKPAEQQAAPQKSKEDIAREGALRRMLKDRERELAELRRQMATKDQPPVEQKPKELTYEDDPGEYLRRRLENTERQLQQAQMAQDAQRRLDAIRAQEQEFERAHPDYRKALEHLEKSEVGEWEASGAARADMGILANAVNAGRQGNQQFKAYADHIDALAARADVIEQAQKENREPEDVAMYLAARDTYLNFRREQVRRGAEAIGGNPAEIAYQLSRGRGWAPQQQQQDNSERARQQVLQQKEISQATQSLSDSAISESGRGPKVIRNRNDVLSLSDDELDALITSNHYKEI